MIFTAYKNDGRLKFTTSDKPKYDKYIESFSDGECLEVEISDKQLRTLPQNRLYWKLNQIVSSELGYSSVEFHDILKIQCYGYEEVEYNGTLYKIPPHSRFRKKRDFSKLIDVIYEIAKNNGILLPEK